MKPVPVILCCGLCGAFDVALYDEVKSLGPRCVDRQACDRRSDPLRVPDSTSPKTEDK